jgi:hypothetical protein
MLAGKKLFGPYAALLRAYLHFRLFRAFRYSRDGPPRGVVVASSFELLHAPRYIYAICCLRGQDNSPVKFVRKADYVRLLLLQGNLIFSCKFTGTHIFSQGWCFQPYRKTKKVHLTLQEESM